MDKTYRIFVVFHNEININYYSSDIINNFLFVNVNPVNNYIKIEGINYIDLWDLKEFVPLGKWYAESEVIFNVYKNKYLYDDVDYIGFIHYDMDFTNINLSLGQNFNKNIIHFQPYTFSEDYRQNFLMDENKPNVWIGSGEKCYDAIFKYYNAVYNTNYNTKQFNKQIVGLCCAFLIEKKYFIEMMNFINPIIDSKYLDRFDIKHKFRMQGGIMERYFSSWILLKGLSFDVIPLKHNFYTTEISQLEKSPFSFLFYKQLLKRILNKIISAYNN